MTFIENYSIYIMIGIVAAGFLLRVRNFGKKGIFLYDEAAYYRETLTVRHLFAFVRKHWKELLKTRRCRDAEERTALEKEYYSSPATHYAYYKAWHIYALTAALKSGLKRDTAIALPSLIMGSLTPAIAYFTCTVAFDEKVGLIAAAMLAVSGLHVLHSRSGGPESGMAFCFQLLLLCSIAHKAALIHSGPGFMFTPTSFLLLAGYGFFAAGIILFHPFWAGFLPGLIILSEAAFAFASGGTITPGLTSAGIGIVLGMLMLCILVSDLPFIICAFLFPESGIIPHSQKAVTLIAFNVRRLADMFSRTGDTGVKIPASHRFGFYPMLFMNTEGPTFTIAAAGGLVFLLVRGAPIDIYLGVQGLVFMGFMTIIPWKATRGILVFFPSIVIFAAVALGQLPLFVSVVALLWILARNIRYSLRTTSLVSGISRTAEYLRTRGTDGFLCTSFPFTSLYSRQDILAIQPCLFKNIANAYTKYNYRFLVIEHHEHFPLFFIDETIELIQKYVEPVFTVEDPCVTFLPLFWEVEYLWPGEQFNEKVNLSKWNNFRANPSERDRRIRVFSLEDVFNNEDFMNEILVRNTIRECVALIKNKKYKDALTLVKKFNFRYPDNPLIKFYIGFCHAKLGREKWTKRIFTELIDDGSLPEDYLSICVDFLAQYGDDQPL